MYEYYPLIVVGAIVGLFSLVLMIAYLTVKDKKQTMGFERQIGDREIMGRLLHYARPYLPRFLLVGVVMLLTIAYDVVSPSSSDGLRRSSREILRCRRFTGRWRSM